MRRKPQGRQLRDQNERAVRRHRASRHQGRQRTGRQRHHYRCRRQIVFRFKSQSCTLAQQRTTFMGLNSIKTPIQHKKYCIMSRVRGLSFSLKRGILKQSSIFAISDGL